MEQRRDKTGIIYCRVSSKEQVDGTSLETQERLCEQYAERNGIRVIKVFVEEGESAKTADRAELQNALNFCSDKSRQIDFFIVYKLDRFARNQTDHVAVRAMLKKFRVNLRSATEQIDETSQGKLMEGIISTFAEFDNNVRSERSKGGMVERVKHGVWVWQSPIGYHRPPNALNIAPDPLSAPHIQFAFEEYSKGVYTYPAIASMLNARGFKTKNGKPARPQLVEKILRNPIYYGEIRSRGFDLVTQGTFEPLVSKELFLKCQKGHAQQNSVAPRTANNPVFPLRGFFVCDDCGRPITGSASKGRNGTYYQYYHHGTSKCPKARSIPKPSFEQLFLGLLNSIELNSKYEKLFKTVVMNIWKTNYKRFDEENASIRKEIGRLEQERQRVFDLHRSGTYDDNDFKQQKDLLNRQIIQKESLLVSQRVEEFNMDEALTFCFDYAKRPSQEWLNLENNFDRRISFQKLILKGETIFDGEKFGTTNLSLIYNLKETSREEKSLLVTPPGIEPGSAP